MFNTTWYTLVPTALSNLEGVVRLLPPTICKGISPPAIVGFPHDIKGSALYGYITLKDTGESRNHDNLRIEINQLITDRIGPIAKLDKIQFTNGLPKTRSGKIMRRILRKIACNETDRLGDTSTLLNQEVVQDIIDNAL